MFSAALRIEGWNETLMAMKKDEKRTLIVPPDLGYGERGRLLMQTPELDFYNHIRYHANASQGR